MTSGASHPPDDETAQRVETPEGNASDSGGSSGAASSETGASSESGASSGSGAASGTAASAPAGNMLPGRQRRRLGLERLLTRLIATCGIVGIGVVIAAIMVSSKSQGWIVGLVVALVTVVLSAILWSSKQL